jgi:branched-chain amino acid transport system substrate-binding protein
MKKFVSLVLVLAVCACLLAGCGSSSSSTAATTDTAAETTADATAEATASTFKFGGIGPLTGSAAIYGQAVKNAEEIAVDEINANGGINGYQVELKFEDDVADGETAVNAYNTLLDWGMQVLAGPVTTGASISVAAKAYEDRVFALTPSASSTDVTDGKDNVYQLCFTDPNQGTGSASYIAANMPESKIAIIYRNDDAYSQGIHDTFVTEAEANGLEIVYEGTFSAGNDTDFSVQLTGAQSAGADLVFLPIYYQPASIILTQANAMGYAPTFFGVDGMDGILTLENFDLSLAEGVMVLTPFSADAEDEKTQSFVAEYQSRYGETPNQFAADAYDVIYALKAALEASECTPDMSADVICEALVATFPTLTFDGLTGTGMTWSANGEVSKMPSAVVIKDGAYVSAA